MPETLRPGSGYRLADLGVPEMVRQMLALRELERLHGLRLYDEVKQSMVEAIRPQWATRFPATRGFRPGGRFFWPPELLVPRPGREAGGAAQPTPRPAVNVG